MSILDAPVELSSHEQKEYERQKKQLDDPHWHDWGKCGKKLQYHEIEKVKYRQKYYLNRLYCEVHEVWLDMSGYEIGHHSFD